MGQLDGKVALISGAARGQGAAEARLFIAEGARVVLGDVLHDKGRALAAELGPRACYVELDVTSEKSWLAAVEQAVRDFKRLDILVNNAGIFRHRSIEDTDEASYMQVVNVNEFGTFLGMRAVIPAMKAAGGGSIVNISSVAGLVGTPNTIAYTASKWAVRGMTKAAALELAPYGIRVNSVHPGLIDTDMTRSRLDPQRFLDYPQTVPLRRLGTAKDVADMVLFIASDASKYSSGAEFVIDGGQSIG